MPTTTHSNVPTTRSGLQRGDPPLSKRKRSNADESVKKRTKSEKDDDEGVEKKRKGGREGKKEQKNKKRGGKGPRCVPVLDMIPPANPISRKTSTDKAKEEAAVKAAAKQLQ